MVRTSEDQFSKEGFQMFPDMYCTKNSDRPLQKTLRTVHRKLFLDIFGKVSPAQR